MMNLKFELKKEETTNFEEAVRKAAEFLKRENNFCFLCHKNLDGDTIGASFALHYALKGLNKNSIVKTFENEFSEKFSFVYPEEEKSKDENFKVEHYVTVDVADFKLLEDEFHNKEFSLCIDHHKTNNINAKLKCVDFTKAASCEIVYHILKELNLNFTKKIADCLYLGISTDTGCFKYENTTAKTHIIAADLILNGANHTYINYVMFDKKSKERLSLEKEIIENLEYYYEEKCVMVFVTNEILKKAGVLKKEQDSIAHIASCVDFAVIAITAVEVLDGFKISVRTKKNCDANCFCKRLGGGGHKRAAGCLIKGDIEFARKTLLKNLKEEFSF